MSDSELIQLFDQIKNEVESALRCLTWAEDEIERAIRRHPAERDVLNHSFLLLTPTQDPMTTTEFVFRGHCRELLDRVARGADARPGTAAEVCGLMREASLMGPLKPSAAGLYFRMWAKAFPDLPPMTDLGAHYEALEGESIDQQEARVRRKLAVKDRTLGEITCDGMHFGEQVQCKYAETSRGSS